MAIPEAIERRRGIISKVFSTEPGKDLMALLLDDFVNIDLMGSTDRQTIENVSKHDLIIYLKDMGEIK